MNGAPAPGYAAAGMVFLTRDCVHWRTIKSPISAIASNIFALLAGTSPTSTAARRCFASAILDHPAEEESSTNNDEYTSAMDSQIKEFFSSPPHICLLQGAFKIDFILQDPPSPSTPKSSISTASSSLTALNGPTSLLDCIFMNFFLHNELNRCAKEDTEQYGKLAWFALTAVIHESAHWLFTKVHGYRKDDLRTSSATPASTISRNNAEPRSDALIALGQRADDCGARAVDFLVGGSAIMISFADGETDVVKRRVTPTINNGPPALSAKEMEALTGAKLPSVIDITGTDHVMIGGTAPTWSTHDAYLVVTKTAANSFCAHGVTRIGSLF